MPLEPLKAGLLALEADAVARERELKKEQKATAEAQGELRTRIETLQGERESLRRLKRGSVQIRLHSRQSH